MIMILINKTEIDILNEHCWNRKNIKLLFIQLTITKK